MARKHHSPEQINQKLREVEVRTSKGERVEDAVRQIEISYQTCLRWRKEYDGMRTDPAKHGWRVNRKHVFRIWREEGLKVPRRLQKKTRRRLNDSSCVRLRPQYCNHVWSHDFESDRLSDSRKIMVLAVLDEFERECLAIMVGSHLTWEDGVAQAPGCSDGIH